MWRVPWRITRTTVVGVSRTARKPLCMYNRLVGEVVYGHGSDEWEKTTRKEKSPLFPGRRASLHGVHMLYMASYTISLPDVVSSPLYTRSLPTLGLGYMALQLTLLAQCLIILLFFTTHARKPVVNLPSTDKQQLHMRPYGLRAQSSSHGMSPEVCPTRTYET